MNEQQGLAGMMGQQQQLPSVKDVAGMLMQGASPEELVQMGLPQELVQAAMQMVMQMQQPTQEASGLAGMGMPTGNI